MKKLEKTCEEDKENFKELIVIGGIELFRSIIAGLGTYILAKQKGISEEISICTGIIGDYYGFERGATSAQENYKIFKN